MRLVDEAVTGWPSTVDLRRSISARVRQDRCASFKLGITDNPERRMRRYEGSYDEMVLLYRSTTHDHVAQLEDEYVTSYSDKLDSCDNIRRGGGGRYNDDSPVFYLYLVIKR